MAVTIKDIAKKAGVTHSAVSKVLNNRTSFVGEETRQRILDTARELNYQPNYFARSMKLGKTKCIGLMGSRIMGNTNADYMSAIAGAIEAAMVSNKMDYTLISFGTNYKETYKKSMDLINKGLVDGLIFIVLSADLDRFGTEIVPQLDSAQIAYIAIHSTNCELPYNNVGMDPVAAGRLAADHLVKQGYTDIGIWARSGRSPMQEGLYKGFYEVLAANGLEADKEFENLARAMDTRDANTAAFNAVMECKHLPRALFCPNNYVYNSVLEGLRQRQVRIPDEVALARFAFENLGNDNEQFITTVYNPVQEKASLAVKMLAGLLDNNVSGNLVHHAIAKPFITVRRSS